MSVLLARAGMPGQGRLFAAEGEAVMRRGWKTGYAVLLSVLLGLGGVGCTTQSSVSSPTTPVVVTPSTSTTSVTASSATPTATNDDEAAKAAVRKFYAAFDDAIQKRETTVFRTTFTVGCRICKEDAQKIDDLARSGSTIETSATQIHELAVDQHPDAVRTLISARLTSPALVVKDAAGKVTFQSSAQTGQKSYIAIKKEGVWLIEGVTG
ncbi:MAG: hypothetical protein IPL93_10940 [Actinomycetales bacterium]|nr:hypothetical protein [Actinomycetales bacterium]